MEFTEKRIGENFFSIILCVLSNLCACDRKKRTRNLEDRNRGEGGSGEWADEDFFVVDHAFRVVALDGNGAYAELAA